MTTNALDRLVAKYTIDDAGCWLWTGATGRNGYGFFRFEGRQSYAHRVAYVLLVGDIPEGMTVDHKCRVRRCINPDHLQLRDFMENSRDNGWSGRTHCSNGHGFTPENTQDRLDGGRRCLTCAAGRLAGEMRNSPCL